MPKPSLRAFVVSASLALLIGTPTAARADDRDAIRALFEQTEELAGLKDEVAKFNPVAGGFKYDADIFGVKASLYVYFPDGGAAAPVAALLLPSVALSTIIPPLKGTPMDVTVDEPVVFVAMSGFLKVDEMPQGVRERAGKIGFGDAFPVDGLVTVVGRVAGHDDALHEVLGLINLKSPLVASYASASKKVKNSDDKDKKKKLKGSVLSLALPADAEWNEPLFFKHTTIQQASVQMRKLKGDAAPGTKADPSILLRINGRARIGAHAAKEYDLFVEKTFDKTADPKSLGVLVAANPTGEVELTDFFAVTQALWATLGFPEEMAQGVLKAGHALPLDQIKLRNPYGAKEAFPEVGGLPDFDKVMFAGANPAAEIPGRGALGKLNKGPLLTVNADATVFGFPAAGLEGAFSITHGIKLEAKVKLPKLGPIEVANTEFDTAINKQTASMKLHVDAVTLGKFDVDVGENGLSFAILPQCPGKPVGLVASFDGFDLTRDFSAKPRMKDCLTPIVKGLIEDGAKMAEVAGDIAGDAASEAEDIAKTATGKLPGFAKARVDAWGKAIANKTHADQALKEAKAAVNGLEDAVKDLDGQIKSLTHDIDKLLKKLWSLVKGEVKDKKKHRQHLIADRDDKRTKLAAANQREQQAAKAEADTPVPYHDAALRQAQADELGARALAVQQPKFAEQARALPDTLKTPEGRRALLDADAIVARAEAAFVAEQKALRPKDEGPKDERARNPARRSDPRPRPEPGIDDPTLGPLGRDTSETKPLTLSDLVRSFGSLEAAIQAPIPTAEGVAAVAVTAGLDAMREKTLRETVPQLPTMAFGKAVLIQTVANGAPLCVTQRIPYDKAIDNGLRLKACDGGLGQQFIFHDNGLIEVPEAAMPFVWHAEHGKLACVGGWGGKAIHALGEKACLNETPKPPYEPGNRLFYDPLDGMIRHGLCLIPVTRNGELEPAMVACPQDPPQGLWRLVDAAAFKKEDPKGRVNAMAAGPLRGVAGGKIGGTNLAPLALD